jgi:NAD(P)H dehydrogenase (quinone)
VWAFFDASSKIWYKIGWKDKIAGGFTNPLSFAGDKAHSMTSIHILAMQHGMVWVGTGLMPGPHNNSDAVAETTPPVGNGEFASLYGNRVAAVTTRMIG